MCAQPLAFTSLVMRLTLRERERERAGCRTVQSGFNLGADTLKTAITKHSSGICPHLHSQHLAALSPAPG